MPQASIDPVVMAAATVLRLQTIVSREIAATDAAVVTVGSLQAGTKENVIPDEAIIKLNVRTFDETIRARVLAAIERIVNAEAEASGAPRKPEQPQRAPTHQHGAVFQHDDGRVLRQVERAGQRCRGARRRGTQRSGARGCAGDLHRAILAAWTQR